MIENGFYYDFARPEPFKAEDLEKIEARMREIVDRDETITREVWDRDEAVEYFKKIGEIYKAEIIASISATSRCRFTGRATGSTSAAARICPRRASSARPSS